MDIIKNQKCPMCHKNTLTLTEDEKEIPFFGKVFIFSMKCDSCNYSLADVEAAEQKESCKYTFETCSEKDMNVRVVKSSTATIKIPQLRMSMTPGPASEGFISNIEGVIDKFAKIVEDEKDSEDKDVKKHAKNLLKKIRKVKFGDIHLKIIIEDPSGNSAIISEKAKVEKLR